MLSLKQNGQKIGEVSEGSTVRLPDGTHVSPAVDGWSWGSFTLEAIVVEPPTPPTEEELLAEERAGMRLSFAQLIIGLAAMGWITQSEGDAWVSGTLPAAVLSAISGLPEEVRFPATIRAKRPSEIVRNDPLVAMLGATQNKTAAELDKFFRDFAGV
ncbi:MAG: hypothetical protein QM805_07710 [Pseudomonas sp.]